MAAYLDQQGILSYEMLFSEFVDFWATTNGSSIVEFIENSIRTFSFYDVFNYGKLIHYSLHEHRPGFDKLVHDFISSRACFGDENVRFLYELDRVLKPYVYSSTTVKLDAFPFEFLQVMPSGAHAFEIRVPERFQQLLATVVPSSCGENDAQNNGFRINHERFQYPYMKSHGLEHNAGYCHGMMIRIDSIVPSCGPLQLRALAARA